MSVAATFFSVWSYSWTTLSFPPVRIRFPSAEMSTAVIPAGLVEWYEATVEVSANVDSVSDET